MTYKIKRFLLDIIYPNRCPFCNEIIVYNEYYCSGCIENLDFIGIDKSVKNAGKSFTVFKYNESVKPFIYDIKENNGGYAISAASRFICNLLAKETDINIDLITCIPASKARMRKNGYNPPALIAAEISEITGIPHNNKLLVKIKETEQQKELNASERQENLKNSFCVRNNKICTGNKILLVDDVRTTGSTLSEAAGALLSAGADTVYTAAVAGVIM